MSLLGQDGSVLLKRLNTLGADVDAALAEMIMLTKPGPETEAARSKIMCDLVSRSDISVLHH